MTIECISNFKNITSNLLKMKLRSHSSKSNDINF